MAPTTIPKKIMIKDLSKLLMYMSNILLLQYSDLRLSQKSAPLS